MALITGTLQVSDAVVQYLKDTLGDTILDRNVLDVGVDNLNAAVQREIDAHNQKVRDMTSLVAVRTTERTTTYGVSGGGEMIETDEFARVPTQKGAAPSPVNFPLRQYQFAIGWTYQFFRNATVRDMLVHLGNAQVAHRQRLLRDIQRALFLSSNYTFQDYTSADKATLNVKRLVNADNAAIPLGPNANSFDASSHTHYDAIDWSGASTAQKDAAVKALASDVTEHGHTAGLVIYANEADESKIRALTEFERLLPAGVQNGTAEITAPGVLDTSNTANRRIGVMADSGAQVYVKPWMPSGYLFAFAAADPMKPLAERVRDGSDGLATVAQNDAYPLYAEYMMAEFGFGAYGRTNGAVLYLGGGAYADPTIN